jgi:hypothetical protein
MQCFLVFLRIYILANRETLASYRLGFYRNPPSGGGGHRELNSKEGRLRLSLFESTANVLILPLVF